MNDFQCFALNSLVQPGTQVRIKGLSSEKGQVLNGRTGTATGYKRCGDIRWIVKLDDDGSYGDGEKKAVSISIKNLEKVFDSKANHRISVMSRDNPTWNESSEGGTIPLLAGLDGRGDFALMVVENKEGRFEPEKVLAMSKSMGLHSAQIGMVCGLCEQLNKHRQKA